MGSVGNHESLSLVSLCSLFPLCCGSSSSVFLKEGLLNQVM